MQLRYGNYSHAVNEAAISIDKQALFDERGRRHAVKETWTIDGELQGADTAAITTAIAALQNAYASDNLNLALLNDDGSSTAHSLISSHTLGGTRVTRLLFPQGNGGEYSTFRTYQITVEGDRPVTSEFLLSWTETITLRGGGPRFRYLQVLNGPPQKQLVNTHTPFTAIQEGRAVGHLSRPAAPPPLWPADEHRDLRVIQSRSPSRRNNALAEYEITWQFNFESAVPLIGNPSAR